MTRPHTSPAALWAGAALAALAAVPWWSTLLGALPSCRLREWTGRPCLTCGSGRSLTALSRGELGEAFTANPLALITALVFLAGGVWAGLWVAGAVPAPALGRRGLRAAALGFLVLAAANWVYLLLRL